MRRQIKKAGRRILNKILIILLLIGLLFYLLGFLKDFDDKVTLLIKQNEAQQTEIHKLQYENERLTNVVVYQHEQIKEIQNVKIKINGEPIKENKEIHKEEKQVHKEENTGHIINAPTIIITTLVTIEGIFNKLLSPVLP